jgi:hypothetical protein
MAISTDFNLGHIDWSIPQVIPGKPETELNIKLLDIIDEYNLHQLVNVSTRKERTLDLFQLFIFLFILFVLFHFEV